MFKEIDDIVWILEFGYDYEGSEVQAVFSCRSKAQKYLDVLVEKYNLELTGDYNQDSTFLTYEIKNSSENWSGYNYIELWRISIDKVVENM